MAEQNNGVGARFTRWPLVRFAFYATATLATIILATIATRLLVPPPPSAWHDLALLKNALLPIFLFVIYAALVHWMERRPATEVSLRTGLTGLLIGACIGAAIIGLTFFILQQLGMAEISAGSGLAGLDRELLALMITVMLEELLFRIILFKILEEIVGSLFAILISTAAFGLAHVANPGATPFALFALSMELGVMLALAYMLTRNVWLPIGIHAGWNFVQGFVLGAHNSGQQHPNTYFQTTFTGPEHMSGGEFGLEASLVTLGFSIFVSLMLLVAVLQKRRWVGLRFNLGSPQASSA